MAGGKKIRKILFRLIGVIIAVALLALLAVSLIIAKPQEEAPASAADRPSGEASPAISVEKEQDLHRLIASFPAPVMSFMSGSGMIFVSATSADAAVDGGFGRIATLNWQTPEGEPVKLCTVWPADALELLEDGYHFMPYTGPALFGNSSVRMENDYAVRIHVATDRALYIVLLPRALSGEIGSICRSLQLFTVDSEKE
ncbi:MAG: hypothetical protein K6F61_01920 [Clostridiales bacterium]|nr:hypothetical protein [Clostridiales bacterium]